MLKLLSYNHPFTYLFIFVLAIVLRLPSFHPQYFSTDEAFYVTAAEKIVDGGVQYVDTWDNKPPLIIWFYSLFVWVFGSGALLAIRIFTVIYLFVAAILLNQFVVDNKLLQQFSLLPALLFLVLCSVPWYAQELNGEMLMILPVILAFHQLVQVTERDPVNNRHLFISGLLMGLSFMIKYQAIFLFIMLLVAYLIVNPPRLAEIFSLFAGFVVTNLVIITVIYFSGALPEFWDIGVLYNLDYILIGKNPGEEVSIFGNLWQYIQLWGVFIVLSLVGVAYFRLNYFTHSIRLRKIESIIGMWFIGAVLTIAMGMGRMYLHYFILAVPPMAIYCAKFFELERIKTWIKVGVITLSLVMPLFTYGVFMVAAFPDTMEFADPLFTEDGWTMTFRKELNRDHILSAHIDTEKVKNGVLVMDVEPEIYLRLGVPCATKYTNFSIAHYKFPFPHNQDRGLVSAHETLPEIYEAFEAEMPEYIIDRNGLFPHLQDQLPLLFAEYREESIGKYKIYYPE